MAEELSCAEVADRSLVERYVAGRLPRDEAESFEAHYLTCARCREELRLAYGLREALAEPTPAISRRSRRRVWIGIGVGLAAAAGLAALVLLRPSEPVGQLARLGAVAEPPIYLGVQVRATPTRADSVFEAAMTAYVEQRYDAATEGLRRALAAGVDSAPAEFFLAASYLMLDRSREAAQAFRRVIALGDTPYLPESRYYLAKALLRLGRGREALGELRLVADREDEIGAQARALADSLEDLLRR